MSSPDPTPGDASPEAAQREAIVVARDLGKRFAIYKDDRGRFFEFFGRRRHHKEHWALRDVNFEIRRGEPFGVIGSNGAGKSTLLKMIAGISEPSVGSLDVGGMVTTLLDLGLGFHDTFSGRENIYLNCTLMGMRREEVDVIIPDIVGFAELGEFIDLPVRTYSAGMKLRLGFSVAAHMNAEIFLVDEVLTVGDEYFQRKCVRKIEQLLDTGSTIILVSHDLHAIRSLCQTVLWLDRGEVRALGPAREVVDRYINLQRAREGEEVRQGRQHLYAVTSGDLAGPTEEITAETAAELVEAAQPAPTRRERWSATVDDPHLRRAITEACFLPDAAQLWKEEARAVPYERYDGENPVVIGSGEVQVLNVQILDGQGHPRRRFQTGEAMAVAVTFRTTEPVARPIMGVAIHRNDGVYIYGPNTRFDGVLDGTYHGIYTYFIHYPRLPLLSGEYRVSVAVFDQNHLHPHVWYNQMYEFEVVQQVEDHGLAEIAHSWGLITHIADE